MPEKENPCDDCLLKFNPVPTQGSPDAKFLIVCGNVSYTQSMKKQNLSPASSKMLAKHLQACGFRKSDFVFTNAVQCAYSPDQWPTKDRKTIEKCCRERLLASVSDFHPKVILALGADAASAVAGRRVKITRVRGVITENEEHGTYVLPMLDPGLAVRYPQNEALLASDCKVLERAVDFDFDNKKAEKAVLGNYQVITDLQFLIDEQPEVLAFDLETRGVDWRRPEAKILTMQFSIKVGEGYVLIWDHPEDPVGIRAKKRLRLQLKELLQNPNTSVIGQNLQFDLVWIMYFFNFRFRIDDDTILLATLVDENLQGKNLDTLAKIYAPEMASYADSFNLEFDKSRMDLVPLDDLIVYGASDCDATLRVFNTLIELVEKDEKLYNYYRRVTIPGTNTLAMLDIQGKHIDEKALDDFEIVLAEYVENLRVKLLKQIPRSIKQKHINIFKEKKKDVNKALGLGRAGLIIDVLFKHKDGFKLKPRAFTKTTEKLKPEFQVPSTSSKDHLPYFFDHKKAGDFCIDLAEWKKVDRMLGTSIRRFRENYIVDGKVNPTYNLYTAVTSRVSSKNPNGQNEPKRGTYVKPYRKIFTAPEGHVIVGADYSQLELRLVADFSNDRNMIDIYKNGGDIHRTMAMEMLSMSDNKFSAMTKDEQDLARFRAKGCIAEGQEVLTNAGNVPIESVTTQYKVFDGIEWVSHDGLVYQGEKYVMEWCGVAATLEHFVYTEIGVMPIYLAAESNSTIINECVLDNKDMVFYYSDIDKTEYLKKYISDGVTTEYIRHKAKGYGFDKVVEVPSSGRLDVCIDGFKKAKTYDLVNCGSQHRFTVEGKLIANCNFGYCIAEGQRVLTNRGLIPIEKIKGCDLVWDGVAWVSHEGVIYQGYKEVITHDGLTTTPDHKIYTEKGMVQARDIKSQLSVGRTIISGDGEVPIKVNIDSDRENYKTKAWGTNGIQFSETEDPRTCESSDLQKRENKQEEKTYAHVYDLVNCGSRHRFTVENKLVSNCFGQYPKSFVIYAKTQFGVDFTLKEAQTARNAFFKKFPGIARFHKKIEAFVQQHGYTRTFCGRKRHLEAIWSPDDGVALQASMQAKNAPIQGTAVTLGILAMHELDMNVDQKYFKMFGFVHDAIYAYVPEEYAIWGAEQLKYYMERSKVLMKKYFGHEIPVPLIADVEIGKNMGEMYEFGDKDLELIEQSTPPKNGRIVQPECLKIEL